MMKQMVYQAEPTKADVLDKGTYMGRRYAIVSYGTHPCAYVECAYAGIETMRERLEKKTRCHGGITYSGHLEHVFEGDDHYFFGWDYAHAGDYLGFFGDKRGKETRKWTTEQILEETKKVIERLGELK